MRNNTTIINPSHNQNQLQSKAIHKHKTLNPSKFIYFKQLSNHSNTHNHTIVRFPKYPLMVAQQIQNFDSVAQSKMHEHVAPNIGNPCPASK